MSRREKRHRLVHEEKSLRLFAFNNFVNGYRPQHGLEDATIVLRTRIKREDEHPALQWQPLAQQIQARRQMTHSTFVMDGTRLDPTTEQDEITHRGVEGPLLKRINNMLVKLAPKGAQLVGAGSTAEIVVKTSVCLSGHTLKGIIGKVILVCPNLGEVQRSLESAERRLEQQGKTVHMGDDGLPAVEAAVILDSANAPMAPQWIKLLSKSFRVTIHQIPAGTSLFGSIAACVTEEREEAPTEGSRSEELRCYVITFRLSPYTKQAEQDIDLSPVTENPNLPPPEDDDEDEDDGATTNADGVGEEEAPIASHEARYMLADLLNVKNATVRFEGNVVDGRTLANVHGLVELDELVPALEGQPAGTTVALSAQLSRDEDGRTMLRASTVENVALGQPASFFACAGGPEAFPTFNYSAIKQYYGAALIRGRKIVLCRSLEGVWRGMRFPHRPHCETYYTPYEAATAAICDQVDVSGDTFYFNPAVAPVTYYPSNERGAVVTLFVAFATAPAESSNNSTGGAADDSVELLEQLHDSYDWYSYRSATAKLPTKAERDALADVRRNVQRAHEAGLYTPLAGHGVFGEDIPAATSTFATAAVPEQTAAPAADEEEATPSASAAAASSAVAAVGCGINVSDLLVLQDPFEAFAGGAAEVAVIARIPTDRVKVWDSARGDADWAGIAGGCGCVVLPPSHDMDVFAQQELPPMLSEDCPPTVRVVVAASSRAIEAAFLEGKAPAASISSAASPAQRLMACLEYADALMCRDGDAFSPMAIRLLQAVRPDVLLISEAILPYAARGEAPATATASTAANTPADFPPLLSIPFASKLPFHPERLSELVAGAASLPAEWGCDSLLWVGGSGWLSTCPLHSVRLAVTQAGAGPSVSVAQASAWWCCVEEGDRPDGLDTSDWDPTHGSRRQDLTVVVLADPAAHEVVAKRVRASLEAALCSATDFRHWHRFADPFNLQ